jgi:glycosyltransferase involved in cell wall biosynthesis
LARRARHHLGSSLSYCVYDKYRNLVLSIDDETAAGILDGTVRIAFEPQKISSLRSLAAGCLDVVRRKIRRTLLRSARAYYAFQILRGRRLSHDEVRKAQAAEFAALAEPRRMPRPQMKPAELAPDVVIISGGHDWEYKDIEQLILLKREYRFQYCAIVYDLIPIFFPQYFLPGHLRLMTAYFQGLISLADRVMCISETTRKDWIRYCREHGNREVHAEVFPLGSDIPQVPRDQPRHALPSSLAGKRYALFVSTIEPRKNHRVLYQAWEACIRQQLIDPNDHRLVFVGRRGWAMDEFLDELSCNSITRGSIIILDDVQDTQLDLIYRRCAFVLFPSFYEGYGLPVVEALGHGKPCISSDAGALAEVGGDLVMRLGPNDVQGWARAIARCMTSLEAAEAWSERIATRYRPTTWDMAARAFFDIVAKTRFGS